VTLSPVLATTTTHAERSGVPLEVITMTVTREHRGRVSGLAVGTWIAVAAVPVAWVFGILLAFVSGEGNARGAAQVGVGLLGVAVFVAMPSLAVALAARLRGAGHRSGRAAIVVAGLLLALTLLVTTLVGPLAMIATVIVVAPLGVYLWRTRSRPPTE
jgi:hypothetical protein